MHDNISYIEDEVEIARRSMPPPPAEFLAPPAFLETALDLSCLVGDDDMFRKGFESSYESIFVKGCHIPRIPRAAGITAIPETKHRIMYRHLIKDLWEILGSLFFYA